MSQKKQGILYILSAGFFFALMTFFVRLSGDLPTMQKAFFRNGIAAVVISFVLIRSEEKFHILKTSYRDIFFRCLFGTTGLICNFYAIDKLAIADANILNKLSPFVALIMSYFILKEKANKIEIGSVVVAFIGAVFIIKPSFNLHSYYAFIGMLGGIGAGLAYTFVRKLGKNGERGPIIIFCFSLCSSIVCLPYLIFNYQPMTLQQTLILILAGLCATGGQFCITAAYKKAPAKEISIYDYSQVLFAAALGFIFLGQLPDVYSVIGYVLIIGSAIFRWFYRSE